jgi:hypothetical protein
VQFGECAILQHSSTPSLRSPGFEDDDETENEARILRAKALGYSVYALRARPNYLPMMYLLLPLSGSTRIGSYAPSLDVYGSYFPAWLICLIVGVILTVLVSQLGRLFDLSLLRKFGPLIPISLVLIFSIATWFLFFAS